jgi:hypothetical protein
MSALSLRHVFGLKGDVKDNVHYVDETSVLYVAGTYPYPILLYLYINSMHITSSIRASGCVGVGVNRLQHHSV